MEKQHRLYLSETATTDNDCDKYATIQLNIIRTQLYETEIKRNAAASRQARRRHFPHAPPSVARSLLEQQSQHLQRVRQLTDCIRRIAIISIVRSRHHHRCLRFLRRRNRHSLGQLRQSLRHAGRSQRVLGLVAVRHQTPQGGGAEQLIAGRRPRCVRQHRIEGVQQLRVGDQRAAIAGSEAHVAHDAQRLGAQLGGKSGADAGRGRFDDEEAKKGQVSVGTCNGGSVNAIRE